MKNKNINIEKLKFIKKLALEYRLSRKNICKLLGQEPTEENQQFIYNLFMNNDEILSYKEKKEFKYLDYETTSEKKSTEKASYMVAQIALLKLQKALLENDEQQIQHIKDNLKKTDTDFLNLRRRKVWARITDEEILTISKYRVKHALSKRDINRLIGIGDRKLTQAERTITNEFWSNKVKILNAYNYDLCHVSVNERKRQKI